MAYVDEIDFRAATAVSVIIGRVFRTPFSGGNGGLLGRRRRSGVRVVVSSGLRIKAFRLRRKDAVLAAARRKGRGAANCADSIGAGCGRLVPLGRGAVGRGKARGRLVV